MGEVRREKENQQEPRATPRKAMKGEPCCSSIQGGATPCCLMTRLMRKSSLYRVEIVRRVSSEAGKVGRTQGAHRLM